LEHAGRRAAPVATLVNGAKAAAASSIATGIEGDALAAFEQLAWLDTESIQKLYRCLPDEPWALALSGASTQIQEHVLKCLSRSSAALLQRRMDSLPAIRLRDVEDAQQRLGEWVQKLGDTANGVEPV
jgi:flagellar motor switch protein FliG